MKYTITLILVCLFAVLVRAQTQTVVDADGNTIVEVITTDPLEGLPTTQTLETLTSTSTTATTTTTPNQGPVGQPVPTLTGQTTYIYTTTDADGDTTVIAATFTPTSITATVTPSSTFTGTVLNYSSWLSMVGTNTVAADATSGGVVHVLSRKACVAGAALLMGAFGGAWLVLV